MEYQFNFTFLMLLNVAKCNLMLYLRFLFFIILNPHYLSGKEKAILKKTVLKCRTMVINQLMQAKIASWGLKFYRMVQHKLRYA